MFHTYVASVLICMLHMFWIFFHVFSGIFASVTDAYFKCSICLQTHVENASSGCFKVDPVLHMLQCDSLATIVCCSCCGAVHACGKRRDGAMRNGGCAKQRGRCGERCGWSPPVVGMQRPRADGGLPSERLGASNAHFFI
jgi:hypothetical protein